ncbi:unnamed protein product [Debaryomyces tyrocola]|nr:unnamed protein product [Debaryomyces tyrocola]
MFVPLDPAHDTTDDVEDLIDQLEESTLLKKYGRCKKFTNIINNTDREITSWKFNEWDYYSKNDTKRLPCNARGLFTVNNEIVVRGYDKFFNVNEVPETKLDFLKNNTTGPYDLTLKENGCIIFISGLLNGDLVVCSKHSTGQRDDLTRNHAIQGEIEIEKQLNKIHKSKKDLGLLLYSLNVTAVTELCNDEFEEHVLPYSKDASGLYLHGLNFNTIKFKTYPIQKVNDFANEWGFKTVDYFQKDSFEDLWNCLQEAAKTGTFDNREVEGFVIRCHLNGDDFFFKFKFEEPYLLYRQFREVTKSLMSNKLPISAIMAKVKKHKYITLKYLEFIKVLFANEPSYKDNFLKGFGIIKIRQLFLKENGLNAINGIELIEYDSLDKLKELSLNDEPTSYKYVLIPISTIGCGKTTVFQTILNLFPNWAHVQNDNIANNSTKNKLVVQCLTELARPEASLVFCDRNNHQKRERQQLFDQFLSLKDNYLSADIGLKFIAINFVDVSLDKQELFDVTYDRISKRGDNHQSIKFNTDAKLANQVMNGFIKRFQRLDINQEPDNQFDLVINMKISADSSFFNSKTIIEELKQFPGLVDTIPSDADIENSFKKALDYKPDFTKAFGKPEKNKKKDASSTQPKKTKKSIVYYGVRIDMQKFKSIIDSKLGSNPAWAELNNIGRVQDEFHITLSHASAAKKDQAQIDIWEDLNKKFDSEFILNKYEGKDVMTLDFYCDIKFKKLIIAKDTLICVDSSIVKSFDANHEVVELKCSNAYPHITIGTMKPEIKPFQSNIILTQLFDKHGYDLQDGNYEIEGSTTVEVINFDDNVILEKMMCFVHF